MRGLSESLCVQITAFVGIAPQRSHGPRQRCPPNMGKQIGPPERSEGPICVTLDLGSPFTLLQRGDDTLIDLGGGDAVKLVNIDLASLPDGWIFSI